MLGWLEYLIIQSFFIGRTQSSEVGPNHQRSDPKILQIRRALNTPPPSGGVQASASQPPDPHCNTSLLLFSRGMCVSLHPLDGAENKTTSLLVVFNPSLLSFFLCYFLSYTHSHTQNTHKTRNTKHKTHTCQLTRLSTPGGGSIGNQRVSIQLIVKHRIIHQIIFTTWTEESTNCLSHKSSLPPIGRDRWSIVSRKGGVHCYNSLTRKGKIELWMRSKGLRTNECASWSNLRFNINTSHSSSTTLRKNLHLYENNQSTNELQEQSIFDECVGSGWGHWSSNGESNRWWGGFLHIMLSMSFPTRKPQQHISSCTEQGRGQHTNSRISEWSNR